MIKSKDNAQVKKVCAWQTKKKERDKDGVFIAEGERLVTEAPADVIVSLYVTASYRNGATGDAKRFLDAHRAVTEEVSDEVMRKMSDVETPQGILAVIRQRDASPAASPCVPGSLYCAGHSAGPGGPGSMAHKPLTGNHPADLRGDKAGGANATYLLLDNIQDTGNLGTIFRSAEAAGVSAIFLTKDCVDVYNPKVVRATMGAIYRVPFVRLGASQTILETVTAGAECDDVKTNRMTAGSNPEKDETHTCVSSDRLCQLRDIVLFLKDNGVTLCAADMVGTVDYDRADLTTPVCFLIGNEANGLSEEAKGAADLLVRIPMAGKTESLNAAVAASVLLFEAARQRRNKA